jgi:hypothetical protein
MPRGDEHADLQARDRPIEKSATPSDIAAGHMMRLNATSMAEV